MQCTVRVFITGGAVISHLLNSFCDWLGRGLMSPVVCPQAAGPHIVRGYKGEFQMVTKLKGGHK